MDTLLNWLWQGAVVAAAAAAALRVWPRSDARGRLRICWLALGALVLLPAVPVAMAALPGDAIVLDEGGRVRVPITPQAVPAAQYLLALWAGWVIWFSARLTIAAVRVQRAKSAAVPLSDAVERRLRQWDRVRRRGRRTAIVVSPRVPAAAVLGVGAPVIAIAPDLLDTLDDEQLDLIVLHEWAHVQRRDDVANAVELIVCAVLGWHPAARWIVSRLRLEREAAADNLAASTSGSARRYAASLAALAVLRRDSAALPVPAAESQLRARITRVLAPHDATPHARIPRALAVALLGVIAIAAGAFQFLTTARVVTAAPRAAGDRAVGEAISADTSAALRQPIASPLRGASPAAQVAPLARQPFHAMRRAAMPTATAGGTEVPPVVAAGALPYLPARRGEVLPSAPVSWPTSSRAAVDGGSRVSRVAAAQGPPSPWDAAADAGAAVGRASTRAASATARAFTRFGTKVTGAF